MFHLGLVTVQGSVVPNFWEMMIGADHDAMNMTFKTLMKSVPFLVPIFWGLLSDTIKKDKALLEEIRMTATWIQRTATLVYKVLDEDVLPAIPT